MKCLFFTLICFSASWPDLFSQAQSYTDPAQAYNKLLLEKNSGTFIRMGNYKVTGTPYLYGGKKKGNVYAKEQAVKDVVFSYNLYLKEIEIYLNGSEKPIIKDWAAVDSFSMASGQEDVTAPSDIMFINAAHLGAKGDAFLQVVTTGKKYSLFKKYAGILSIVSTNYVDATLRQFDINYEYFYKENGKQGINKLKVSPSALRKEFAAAGKCVEKLPDVSLFTDVENYLVTFFEKMELCPTKDIQ